MHRFAKDKYTNTQMPKTSKVPRLSYAIPLEEQREQLKADGLMLRFAASRRHLSTDSYRPRYHFVSPESTLNDPNGLCFWQGRWHLFYQAYPPEDPRQHWGHAISDDLIHWSDLPYAIYPDPEYACFSGSTLVEDNRVIAMYHGTEDGDRVARSGYGNMVAVSSDPFLLDWEKVTGKAVIPDNRTDGVTVFDPCIWKRDGMYYSLSGGMLPCGTAGRSERRLFLQHSRKAAHFLFRSQDLKTWEYLHPFVEGGDLFSLLGDDGACPYFWPLGDRHVLLFTSHMSGPKYLLGDYDTARDKFVATSGGRFAFGAGCNPGGINAPSATPDGQGGVFVLFNVSSAKPTESWNQIMSLPRRLSLLSKDEIAMEPAGDIASLRADHSHLGALALPANQEIVLTSVQGNVVEISAEIDPQNAPLIEMNVLRSPGKEEFTRIAFYRQRGCVNWDRFTSWKAEQWFGACDSLITLDSSYSSVLPDVLSRAPETAPVYLKPDEPLQLRVFIDKSIVEVFVNGRQCVALRVYPGRTDSVGVSLRAQGSDAALLALDVWQMKSIY